MGEMLLLPFSFAVVSLAGVSSFSSFFVSSLSLWWNRGSSAFYEESSSLAKFKNICPMSSLCSLFLGLSSSSSLGASEAIISELLLPAKRSSPGEEGGSSFPCGFGVRC